LDINPAEQSNKNKVECIIDKVEVSNTITEPVRNNIQGIKASAILHIEADKLHMPPKEEERVSNRPS
jgi:hypothetical protein